MANALGQMPNAPLIYVLAQVRFNHVPRMDKRWENFHERVFAHYPLAEPEQIQQLTIKDGNPSVGESVNRWNLLSDNRRSGIIVAADSLVFHTAQYQDSGAFIAELDEILRDFSEIIPEKGVRVMRQGLRYVDLLLPEKGLAVNDQVIETLRMPKLPSVAKPERMEQMVTYKTDIGGMLVMRHRQSISPDLLPADLFPNNLEVAARLTRNRPEGQAVGLLDYDHHIEREMDFDVAAIADMFRGLRAVSSAVFKDTTTKEAQALWKMET